ncbi:MAG TPA: hypothetical protein VK507_03450 [Iamia sp.]|nr:hypothetical protein [Iamia sp.]
MAFWRKTKQPDPDHPEPVEIALGVFPAFQVNVVLADLKDRGYRFESWSQDESAKHGGMPIQHFLLVHADDVDEVRQALVEAELL